MMLSRKTIYLAVSARVSAVCVAISTEIAKLPRKTIYLASAVGIVAIFIIIAVTVFVLGPQYRAIKNIENIIRTREAELVDAHMNKQDGKDVWRQKLSSLQQNLCKYVVSMEQASDFTVDINKLAKQTGLQELSSTNRMQGSYGSINECRHIREGRIQIKFRSSFSQFAEFINSLERYTPLIFVDMFKIKRSKDNDKGHHVDMVLTFFVGQNSLKDIMNSGNISTNINGLTETELVAN